MSEESLPEIVDMSSMQGLREMLDNALASATFPWWEWDITQNRVTFNDLKVSMLGYDPEEFKGAGYQAFTNLLHPDDYERAMQAMRDHLEGRASIYQVDYRIRRPDGAYQWYMDRGCTLKRDANGKPRLLRGLVLDLGEEFHRRAQDEVLLKVFRQALPDPSPRTSSPITICCVCTKLKISDNQWVEATAEMLKGFHLNLSHGICGDCIQKLYPEETVKT